MNSTTIQAFITALTPLAEKIGQGGQWMFELAVRQAYVDGIESSLVFAVLLIGGIVFGVCLFRKIKEVSAQEYRNDTHGYWVLGVILGGILTFGLLASANEAINALLNPQWYALQVLISQFIPTQN